MKIGSYLFSFAKARGNIAAVALAAVLMAANATVASAQNKATKATEQKILLEVLTTFLALILRQKFVQAKERLKPTEIRLCVCITSVPKSF